MSPKLCGLHANFGCCVRGLNVLVITWIQTLCGLWQMMWIVWVMKLSGGQPFIHDPYFMLIYMHTTRSQELTFFTFSFRDEINRLNNFWRWLIEILRSITLQKVFPKLFVSSEIIMIPTFFSLFFNCYLAAPWAILQPRSSDFQSLPFNGFDPKITGSLLTRLGAYTQLSA